MKIYLIRHGETAWNKERRLQGRKDISLNENGVKVAKLTAEGLAQVKFDKVYSSPLKRAFETATLVTAGRYAIEKEMRLIEIDFGACEGACGDLNCTDNPHVYAFFKDPGRYEAPEGGETLEALCERTWDFMQELMRNPENADKTILICTHGTALQSILVTLKGLPMADFWKGGAQRNCSVAILDVTDGNITIEQENVIYYDDALSTNLT